MNGKSMAMLGLAVLSGLGAMFGGQIARKTIEIDGCHSHAPILAQRR
jgi:hypothetical protein